MKKKWESTKKIAMFKTPLCEGDKAAAELLGFNEPTENLAYGLIDLGILVLGN